MTDETIRCYTCAAPSYCVGVTDTTADYECSGSQTHRWSEARPAIRPPSMLDLLAALLDAIEVHTVDGHCVGFTGDPREVYAAWAPARALVDSLRR